jgi:hypothetical protein
VRALLLLRAVCLLLAGLLIVLTAGCAAPPPRLLMNGIAADRLAPDGIRALPVPSGPAGRLAGPAGLPAGGGPAVLSPAQRRFLAAGTVPGQTRWQRRLAAAALADPRRPGTASGSTRGRGTPAGWRPRWP